MISDILATPTMVDGSREARRSAMVLPADSRRPCGVWGCANPRASSAALRAADDVLAAGDAFPDADVSAAMRAAANASTSACELKSATEVGGS